MSSTIASNAHAEIHASLPCHIHAKMQQGVGDVLRSIGNWHDRRRIEAEIRTIPRHQLRDIGIDRPEVAFTLFGPAPRT